jgi:hypothetical protein
MALYFRLSDGFGWWCLMGKLDQHVLGLLQWLEIVSSLALDRHILRGLPQVLGSHSPGNATLWNGKLKKLKRD